MLEERATRHWLDADGVVHAEIRPRIHYTGADSVASLSATRALAPTLPALVLVDARNVRSATHDARHYWQGPEAREVLAAMAIVADSPVPRIIAAFVIRLVKTSYPITVFATEAEAHAWLLEQRR